MSFRNELALTNLYIERNIVARGGIVAHDIYGEAIHAPSIETQELFVKGMAHVHELSIQTSINALPSGGIQSNGDFFLTAVTAHTDGWISPHPLRNLIVSGNRIGQMCSVYIEMDSEENIPNGSVLFSSIPDSFWPHTKTLCPVSIGDGTTFSQAALLFDPLQHQLLFYGTWPTHATLMATLNYFRIQNQND